ncbi:DnaJ C-terminal domain-containing protein [Nannocystis punicea]|uniref:DnaJ domain-containing protein n=1 Tax=Nannocystis punicea TaxID=2995304 RepID=A0ABY7GY69_9BACT|nr:DnaJ C-terminal domain-containing protein [Nannocystis poenicansa]WAS91916.1 DnaJ domain-containing protein [Nannocystis poenicansa]
MTDEEIHRAWRRLIASWHPDRHSGSPYAEAETAKINEAYQAIKALRARPAGARPTWESPPPPPPPPPRPSPPKPPPPPPRRGADVRRDIQVSWEIAFKGGTIALQLNGEVLEVRVPAGCEIGKTWRRKGRGRPGRPPGDLVIRLARYTESVPWRIKGLNVHMTVQVTFYQIYLQEAVTIKTPWGQPHRFVPKYRNTEATRIKGAGVKKGRKKGDVIIEWDVVYPPRHDPHLTAALRDLQG